VTQQTENGKEKADVGRNFDLVNYRIQTI